MLPPLAKGVSLPSPRRAYPAQSAVVDLVTTDFVSISVNAEMKTATRMHSLPTLSIIGQYQDFATN